MDSDPHTTCTMALSIHSHKPTCCLYQHIVGSHSQQLTPIISFMYLWPKLPNFIDLSLIIWNRVNVVIGVWPPPQLAISWPWGAHSSYYCQFIIMIQVENMVKWRPGNDGPAMHTIGSDLNWYGAVKINKNPGIDRYRNWGDSHFKHFFRNLFKICGNHKFSDILHRKNLLNINDWIWIFANP